MALSGTLETFSIPDVLHLLAGTGKTGVLTVQGDRGRGRVWLDGGALVEAEAIDGRSVDPDAGVFELLRFGSGSFEFDGQQTSAQPGEPCDVDAALASATALLEEWREIEAVVPSLDVQVQLCADVDGEVILQPHQWRMITGIGRAGTGRALAELLGLGEFDVCRSLRDLVVDGLAEVDEIDAAWTPNLPTVDVVPEPVAWSEPVAAVGASEVPAPAATAGNGLGLHLATFVATGEAPDVEVHVPDFRVADGVDGGPEPELDDAAPVWNPIRDAVAADAPEAEPVVQAGSDGDVEERPVEDAHVEEVDELPVDEFPVDEIAWDQPYAVEPIRAEEAGEVDLEVDAIEAAVPVAVADTVAGGLAEGDADDFLNQLANLSPRAKAAIEATAAPDELGAVPAPAAPSAETAPDAGPGEVNQNLLLRFLSSTKP